MDYMSTLRQKLCMMCLSDDRDLYLIKMCHLDLCNQLFAPLHFDACHCICWECKGNLDRIVTFKTRVFKARNILTSLIHLGQGIIMIEKLTKLAQTESEVVSIDESPNINDPLVSEENCDVEIKKENFDINIKEEPQLMLIDIDRDGIERYDHRDNDETNDSGPYILDLEETTKNVTPNFEKDKINVVGSDNPVVARESQLTSMEHDDDLSAVSVIKDLTEEEFNEHREKKRKSAKYEHATFKCSDCIMGFESEVDWNQHAARHDQLNGQYSCPVCRFRFSKQEIVEKHATGHYKLYKCTMCNFECAERLSFRRHCDRNHRPRRCRTCGLNLKTVSEARKHRFVHKEKKVFCQVCSKPFYENNKLRAHMLSHDRTLRFECEICHKKMRSKSGIDSHRRRHTQKPSGLEAYCVECDVQFKDKHCYTAHLRLNSKHVKPENLKYKCDHCGKGYVTLKRLKDHINVMHTKILSHFCQLCNKGFFTKTGLKIHKLRIHEGKEAPKNKLCNVCGKTFRVTKSLKDHMNSHTGARPYSCQICSASFAHDAALYTHNLLRHKKLKRPLKKNKAQQKTNKSTASP